MGVPGFWEFASETVVKSAQGPARDRPAVVWASGFRPLGGLSLLPCPLGEEARGPGQEMRQSSSPVTQRGRGEAGRAGSRALGREGLTASTSSVRKPGHSRCHVTAPRARCAAQSFTESTHLTCTLASEGPGLFWGQRQSSRLRWRGGSSQGN